MKLPLEWISDYTSIKTTPQEFARKMTLSGSKVESYICESDAIRNIVAGKVVSKKRHPDSDHLWVCSVFMGVQLVQIVTGAQNVNEGSMVPVALDGGILAGGKEIRNGEIRGVKSEGMMCSLAELGLTPHDYPECVEDGIMILPFETAPGADVSEVVGLSDTIFEFEITNNRPDCFGILGLAREAAVTYGVPLKLPQPKVTRSHGNVRELLSVENKTPKNCLRYTGAVVENVRVRPSPHWMRERLRRCGVRPINNIVDITNYVMLEYNQPLHAFDYRHVADGAIVVRQALPGETLVTLDEVPRKLSPDMMVIADPKKPLAIAGVMGGEHSGIVEDTTAIILESACFEGVNVRTTARALGMRTESSSRFEKGLDAHNAEFALMRALELVEQLDAGDIVAGIADTAGSLPAPAAIPFDDAGINALLGTDISADFMLKTLEQLGCTIGPGSVTPPSFRADLKATPDLAEEVARFYGYDRIPQTVMSGAAAARPSERARFERMVVAGCIAGGLYEINTSSFMGEKDLDLLGISQGNPLRKRVRIQNPLGEDTAGLRTTALPAMMAVLARNYNNRTASASFFEMTKEFVPGKEKLPEERHKLVLGSYGDGDYYRFKGIVELLARRAGLLDLEFERLTDNPVFHSGRAASITCGGKMIGMLGEASPATAERYGIRERVYLAELDLDRIYAMRGPEARFVPLPKYPALTRDIALVCDVDVPSSALEKALREGCGSILESLCVFDVYTGDKIETGKKSIAYSLVLRDPQKTLTDEDADAAIARALALLQSLGIKLRS